MLCHTKWRHAWDMHRVNAGWGWFFFNLNSDLKIWLYVILGQDSENNLWFPVRWLISGKTGSSPKEMIDPSFDAEYLTYPGLFEVSDSNKSTSGFIGGKPLKNR